MPQPITISVSDPGHVGLAHGPVSTADLWVEAARADGALCRAFSEYFGAHVRRSLRCQRVAWRLKGEMRYSLVVPDPLPGGLLKDEEWGFYSVLNESPFRRTRAEREASGMILLADSAEDWADLLRQAVRDRVFDVEYSLSPRYVSALGDDEAGREPDGYVFSLRAYAPSAVSVSPFSVIGTGATPEGAARAACRAWLQEHLPEVDFDAPGG